MSIFNSGDTTSNLAKNLALQSVMKSTSRFIRNEPVPQGNYETQNNQKVQRYGSNRRLNQKKLLPSQSSQSESQYVETFTTETPQQEIISNKAVPAKNGPKIIEKLQNKTQSRQNFTPKPKRPLGVKDQQKKSAVQGSPKSIVSSKIGSETSGKNSALFDFIQTPQAGRYGADRRIQSQKVEEIISKYQNQPIKLATQIQPKSEIYETPAPNSRYKRHQKQNSNLSSPITILDTVTQKTVTTENANISIRKDSNTMSRSKVINKGKDNIQMTKTPNKQTVQGQSQKKKRMRSNIIFFSIKRIYKAKLLQNFQKIKQNLRARKQKENKFTKIFIQKLNKVQKNANLSVCLFFINKLAKIYHKNNSDKNNIRVSIQQNNLKIYENCRKLLPNILNQSYKSKVSYLFNFFKLLKNKKYSQVQCKLSSVCHSLLKKRINYGFSEIKKYSTNKFIYKNINLHNILLISKHYKKNTLQYVFRKLLSLPQNVNENIDVVKQSPIQILKKEQSSPETSGKKNEIDEKIIRVLQQRIQQNNKKLKQVKDSCKKSQRQLEITVQNLRNSCSELGQINDEKEKMKQQLKQKAQSLQIAEQDYIQNSDLLIESRFTFLYDVYIKLQKLGVEEVKISDFYHIYPSLEEEIRNDNLVSQWLILQHNIQLKKQVAKYEGEQESERKAAKITNQECNMLGEMIKGYIKQKYTWQWVRNALTNLTMSS